MTAKLKLFLIGVLLGFVSEAIWFSVYISWPYDLNSGDVFVIYPLLSCILISCYFIFRKRVYLPILGVFLGFILGIVSAILLSWGI